MYSRNLSPSKKNNQLYGMNGSILSFYDHVKSNAYSELVQVLMYQVPKHLIESLSREDELHPFFTFGNGLKSISMTRFIIPAHVIAKNGR